MRYIPLKESSKENLEGWLEKANEILQELKAEADPKKRRVIIHKNKSHWRDKGLLKFLMSLSDGKCWYTEARFTAEYPHLEHFRPKSCARDEDWKRCHDGYWWLAFDIENYRLSKPVPNTRKGTYFPLQEQGLAVCEPGVAVSREAPVFLDPTVQEDCELISFNALGEPEPCANPIVDLCEWDLKRIEFSIKSYGLRDDSLCNERKALWVSLTNQFGEYASLLKKYKEERCLLAKGRAEEKMKQLEKYLAADQCFTGTIKACFDAHPVGRLILRRLAVYPVAA